jgi:hypothetical protein
MENDEIRKLFHPLFAGSGGIDSWLGDHTPANVFDRLREVDRNPLSRTQLNQLLVLSHEAGLSVGFFTYYWLETPDHPYDVTRLDDFEEQWIGQSAVQSLPHLRWGIERFYIDALLYFGNVRTAYRTLRDMKLDEIRGFFRARRIDSDGLSRRGAPLPLHPIPRDHRYLISEMACKSLDASPDGTVELRDALIGAFRDARERGTSGSITVGQLLKGSYVAERFSDRAMQLEFSADEVLEEAIETEADLERQCGAVIDRFVNARRLALENTELYLSMIDDLDVYVATSMRNRGDFRNMAAFCDAVFGDSRLVDLHLRYFDPTTSAAVGHEDKGLIECLMVKCAKALVYSAGKGDSYGKDAEAAMALSLGKPVIFFCDEEQRQRFYRDVHPLSRLIDFQTGVAVGVMVASSADEVAELLWRIFSNRMEYEIEQRQDGFLRLREKLTGSVVRLQTSNELLRETFWNYYHRGAVPPPAIQERSW